MPRTGRNSGQLPQQHAVPEVLGIEGEGVPAGLVGRVEVAGQAGMGSQTSLFAYFSFNSL